MIAQQFRTERVSPRITRIYAFATELMYLVEGEERAALLDTGSGVGFVKPLIDRLTDKPLVVLLTHGHVDHAMGASEFPPDTVYINQEDAYIYEPHSTYQLRKEGLFLMEGGDQVTEEDFTPIVPISAYHDLKEGCRFDLGGITVEVYACPGHTRGSLVMLLPEERTLLLGDACNSRTFLFDDYSLTVEEYQASLCRLREKLTGRYDTVLASHGDGWLAPEVIDESIALCDAVLAGTSDEVPFQFRGAAGLLADADAQPHHANLVYHPNRIKNCEGV